VTGAAGASPAAGGPEAFWASQDHAPPAQFAEGRKAAIGRLASDCAFAVEMVGWLEEPGLLPEEAANLGNVAPIRRQEFAAGRRCARLALARLGIPIFPLLRGPNREPLWPEGISGSITHCRGYAAAVAAPREQIATIGIDAEPHEALPNGVFPMVALPAEVSQIAAAAGAGLHWGRLLFSIKESVYKAWFPLARDWLGFKDAHVTIAPGVDASSGVFEARLLVKGPMLHGRTIERFAGRYSVESQRILTVAMPVWRD